MPGLPGPPRLLKGAFVRYDGTPGSPKVIVFPYNPETLTRMILPGAAAPSAGQTGPAAGSPQETIMFTLVLDATDRLEQADPQADSLGVYPVLSAIELLTYPPLPGLSLVTLFIWGPNRVVPVRITGFNIVESLFQPNLSPIQATVQVTLSVTGADDVPSLGYLLQHLTTLSALAGLGYSPSPAGAGITLPLPGSVPPSGGGAGKKGGVLGGL